MLCRACVSTSSVTKTLLTFSSRSNGCELLSIVIYPFYATGGLLVQLYSFVTVVLRHIGQNHYVPDLQSVLNLDGIYRGAAQGHLHLIGVLAVRLQLEELHRGVRLSEHRAAHEYHIAQTLQLDGSIHAQVRPRSRRQPILADD